MHNTEVKIIAKIFCSVKKNKNMENKNRLKHDKNVRHLSM